MKRAHLLVVLVCIALAGAGAGYIYVTRSLPQVSGTVRLDELGAPVRIVRDRNGVPHLYADTASDLFLAQGFVHAQDRLWQMELSRRRGHGTTAELLGGDSASWDAFVRTVGLTDAAERELELLDFESRQNLEAYSRGVNALLARAKGRLPVEFELLGTEPARWQPIDSLVWLQAIALETEGGFRRELLRANLIQELGVEAMFELVPPYPDAGPFIIESFHQVPGASDDEPRLSSTDSAAAKANLIGSVRGDRHLLPLRGEVKASAWVVPGSLTVSGEPLLANDIQLGTLMPRSWYMIGLHCNHVTPSCPFDVVGLSIPGVPAIVVGHNQRVAWGVASSNADQQDLFVEKLHPDRQDQYEYRGEWTQLVVRDEVISIRGAPELHLSVRATQHGPIINVGRDDDGHGIALQRSLRREAGGSISSLFALNRAQNWADFRQALRNWSSGVWGMVYADVEGNVGYQLAGLLPIRKGFDGTTPTPGWSGEAEWAGYFPFEALPAMLYQYDGPIIAAGNQVLPGEAGRVISMDWDAPFRARRLDALLHTKDGLSSMDLAAIQQDTYASTLVKLKERLVGLPTQNFLTRRALEYVKQWDGRMSRDSVAALVLESTFDELLKELFAKRMTDRTFTLYADDTAAHRMLVDRLLDDRDSEWWDDPTTLVRETRDDRLVTAYARGVDNLGNQFGDWPPDWKWGRVHTAMFSSPFSSIPVLDRFLSIAPVPVSGSDLTISRADSGFGEGFAAQLVPASRIIVDLADWDKSMWILAPGQSGQVLSPHYADLVGKWQRGEYETLPFTREAVEENAAAVLTLTP